MKNEIEFAHDHAVIRIVHKGQMTSVLIDVEDVDLAQRYRWCVSMRRPGYSAVTSSAIIDGKQKTIILPRHLLSAEHGKIIDHISGDTFDNRRMNLRVVNASGNAQNQGGWRTNPTRTRGVTRKGNCFVARAQINKRMHNIGHFKTISEAAVAIQKFRADHMPFSRDALVANQRRA